MALEAIYIYAGTRTAERAGDLRVTSRLTARSRAGDHGKGSSAIEGKENRRLRDVQNIPRSTREDPRNV